MVERQPIALASPKKLLDQHGLRAKHSFGQNFLSDVHHCARIAQLAAGEGDTRVLELGAGLGALTERLLALGNEVVAVERDRDLVPVLESLFEVDRVQGRLRIVEGDAKAVDWLQLLQVDPSRPVPAASRPVVTGNLPYQITGPLLERAVGLAPQLRRAVFLVQKEVADRLSAHPGTKQYGALTVFVQAQFRVNKAFTIRAGAFFPPPRVDSAVVVLEPHAQPLSAETPRFRQLVKAAFHGRRKTLRNAWRAVAEMEILQRAAAASGIDLDARGETLSVAQFATMTQELGELEEAG